MLNLSATIDTDEWDALFKRLDGFLTGSGVHDVGARAVAGRVRQTYDFRFAEAYGRKSNRGVYAQKKQELGLPSGTLTGASFRAISSEADEQEGRVLLKGVWPGFDLGDPYPPFGPQEFSSLTYGEDRPDFPSRGEINWLHVIPGDEVVAAAAVEGFFDFIIEPKNGLRSDIVSLLTNDESGELSGSLIGRGPDPRGLIGN